MCSIIKRDEFIITQDDINKNRYSLIFSTNSEPIIRSISNTKIILGTTTSENYDLLSFNATSIETFKQYITLNKLKKMDYKTSLKMVLDLSLQLDYLLKKWSKTFLGYNPDNLIVVDGNKFIYISNEYLLDIDDEEVTITFPFSQKDFLLSPELYIIKELPSNVYYKTTYFSLGIIIIYGLIGNMDFLKDEINDRNDRNDRNERNETIDKKMNNILESIPIKGTKLYSLIKRCLDEEPKRRSIIFI